MTNKEIAGTFNLLAKVMELHGENKFKIRSYQNAYNTLRKLGDPLSDMEESQLSTIKGVGKAIAGKITELIDTGKMATLSRYLDQTPAGIQEMLQIKGFGPKKVKVIWEELGIESIGELLYAVNENRLIELKGFGKKTQEDLKQKLEYYQRNRNRFHFAVLEQEYLEILPLLQQALPGATIEPSGAFRRKVVTPEAIELMIIGEDLPVTSLAKSFLDFELIDARQFKMKTEK